MNRASISMLILAVLASMAGQGQTVPKAVEALRQLQVSEHIPARGDGGAASWSTGAYVYDPSGNISAIGSQYFLYDTTGRLTGANVTAAAGSLRQNYTYDVYGNMTGTEMAGITTPIATDSGSNHLNGASVQYDAAGNLIQEWSNGDTITYQYDGMNMLQRVTDTRGNNLAYLYTADDERIWSYDLGANVSHWAIRDLGGKMLRDYVQDGIGWSVAKDYFYRDGLLLAAAAPSGVTEHFSLDHLGTPRLITDQNHNKIGFHVYFPFGNEWSGVGQQETPAETMRFTGHERDKDLTGSGDFLDYMHARHYTPLLARFLTIDPEIDEKIALQNPQVWNRYSYVLNNPMNMVDPNGRLGCKVDGHVIPCHIVVVYNKDKSKGTIYLVGTFGKGKKAKDKVLLKGKVVVGADGKTPTGKFTASRWEKDHVSTKYGWQADTPWSKSKLGLNAFGPFQLHMKELEDRGIWIHGTMGPSYGSSEFNRMVSSTSHGCVRCANQTIIGLHNLMPEPNGNKILISIDPKDAPDED